MIGVFMVALFVLSSAEIVARFVFNNSMVWVTEFCRFILIWLVFLGATLVTKRASHLSVGISLDNYVTGKKRLLIKLSVHCCIMGVLILIAFHGTKAVLLTGGIIGPATRLPMYLVWSAIPINAVLILYYIIRDTLKLFTEDR